MELFDDRKILADLLYEAIREEGQRIVSTGVATAAEVLDFVNPQIKQSFTTEDEVSDDFLRALGNVHRKLSTMKLPGDLRPVKKAEAVADDCACHVKVAEPETTDDTAYAKVAIDKLVSTLESLIYTAGKFGSHTKALAMERRLNELKRLAESGELVVSEGFKAEIELIRDFKAKFPNKNISAELRLQVQNFKQDPVTAASELRKQWNS